ncbi:MAG: hypothetical protein KF819_09685 [Labilithrix sp.]|nr:hypothetical protein [Labilithrix sp.]
MSSTGPRRLLDYGDRLSPMVKGAIEAERAHEDPEAARMRKIERAIAVAVGSAPLSPEAPPADASGAIGAGGGTTTTTWLVAAGAAAALAVATVFMIGEPTESRVAAPRTPSTAVVARKPIEHASVPSMRGSTVRPEDLPSAPPSSTPVPAAPKAEVEMPAAPAAASEADEIALIARAHDQLRASPADALASCRDHERRHPGGHFTQEREAIAIEALVYLGRKDEAERRFAAFRARFPSSTHRVHLESLFSR